MPFIFCMVVWAPRGGVKRIPQIKNSAQIFIHLQDLCISSLVPISTLKKIVNIIDEVLYKDDVME